MFDHNQATEVVRKMLPNGRIQKFVVYNDLYLFQVFTDDPDEEEMDPFYSVNRATGEFKEFSIITDGNISEIMALFAESKGGVQ